MAELGRAAGPLLRRDIGDVGVISNGGGGWDGRWAMSESYNQLLGSNISQEFQVFFYWSLLLYIS